MSASSRGELSKTSSKGTLGATTTTTTKTTTRGWTVFLFAFVFVALIDVVVVVSVDEYLFFEILKPAEIAYSYKLRAAKDFGTPLNFSLDRVYLVPSQPPDACELIQNVEDVEGNVAMMERGGCSFLSKTINAEKAGARAAIVYDNQPSNDDSYIDMVQDDTSRETRIPSLFLLGKDGHVILRTLTRTSSPHALINIPVNMSNVLAHQAKLPPWTLW